MKTENSWREIYVSNLHEGFNEIRREDVDLSKLSHANIKRNRKFSPLITENGILSSQVR